MMKPTVGRMVWYWPEEDDGMSVEPDHERGSGYQACAALVVAVLNDRCVNLVVLDAVGTMFARNSVFLAQEEGGWHEECGYASWMPYELGQLAKAEALEESLSEVLIEKEKA